MCRADGAYGWRRKQANIWRSGGIHIFSGGKVSCFPLQKQIHYLPEIFLENLVLYLVNVCVCLFDMDWAPPINSMTWKLPSLPCKSEAHQDEATGQMSGSFNDREIIYSKYGNNATVLELYSENNQLLWYQEES